MIVMFAIIIKLLNIFRQGRKIKKEKKEDLVQKVGQYSSAFCVVFFCVCVCSLHTI